MKALENLIKNFESCSLVPYKDIAGRQTIGWGHLIEDHESYLLSKRGITQEQADSLFNDDLSIRQRQIITPAHLNEHQRNAVISFVFNIGVGAYNKSTFKDLLFDSVDVEKIADEILRWCHAGAEVNQGLLKRRVVEHAIFESGRDIINNYLTTSNSKDAQRILDHYWSDYNA